MTSPLPSQSKIEDEEVKPTTTALQEQFSLPLLAWFDAHGRKDLPWQKPRHAYRVWISEIMLQQTQVKTVIPYFNRFMEHFPDIWHLAQAGEDQVLACWSGLGYYSRARLMAKTAKIVCQQYQGKLPRDLEKLKELPGIGPSTAAAIASQAFNLPTAILDGNVQRILSRYFIIPGELNQPRVKNQLWHLAHQCMPQERCADYTQAIMDLGAICCTAKKPTCNLCPLQLDCLAHLQNKSSEYPHKKQKKKNPVKEQQFLVLYTADHHVYLEKRASIGLWGGLWCPLILDKNDSPQTYLKEAFSLSSPQIDELLELKHAFTHFHLRIKALAIFVKNPSENKMSDLIGEWFKASELTQLGLAKPVKVILQRFYDRLEQSSPATTSI